MYEYKNVLHRPVVISASGLSGHLTNYLQESVLTFASTGHAHNLLPLTTLFFVGMPSGGECQDRFLQMVGQMTRLTRRRDENGSIGEDA